MTQVIAEVTHGGQITIPAQVRDALGLQEGDFVVFSIDGDHVRVGFARGKERPVSPFGQFLEGVSGLDPRETIAGILADEELRRQR